MAILQCRHCGGDIDSDARRAQCRECRALFPFQCSVCERNLRSPFPIFEDERHLTMDEPPQPLCEDHFLRKCPDCSVWFQNDENPGFFRCLSCAAKAPSATLQPEWSDAADADSTADTSYAPETYGDADSATGVPLAAGARAGIDPNAIVLGATGCAVVALMGWFLMNR